MRKLYRSRRDRVVSGVCGGLADYFGVDVTVIRLLWAIAVFAAGTGVVAYIVAILIIPLEPCGHDQSGPTQEPRP